MNDSPGAAASSFSRRLRIVIRSRCTSRVVAGAPHRAEHLPMRRELAGVLDEVSQQSEFGRRQVDLGAADVGSMVVEIDD